MEESFELKIKRFSEHHPVSLLLEAKGKIFASD